MSDALFIISVADAEKRKGGAKVSSAKREKIGVKPTSVLAARGSPILDLRRTATNSQLIRLG